MIQDEDDDVLELVGEPAPANGNAAEPKIIQFPGAITSPLVLLHSLLERVGDIESITVVVAYKGEASGTDVMQTTTSIQRLAYDGALLQCHIQECLTAGWA